MKFSHYQRSQQLIAAIAEARKTHAYWLLQKSLRAAPEAKAHAAALASAWQTTHAARQAALADHTASRHTLTA